MVSLKQEQAEKVRGKMTDWAAGGSSSRQNTGQLRCQTHDALQLATCAEVTTARKQLF
jgi:hypothetical protein